MSFIGKLAGEQAPSKKYIHIKEVAKKLGVHPQTIKRWIKKGKVKITWGKDRRGWIYINKDDLKKLKEYNNSIIPQS